MINKTYQLLGSCGSCRQVTTNIPDSLFAIISYKYQIVNQQRLVRRLNALVNASGRNRLRGAKGDTRPVIFFPRGAVCRTPSVKGLTMMVNSIYNGQRFEDLWLDQ